MKRLFAIPVTGGAKAAIPAHAGSTALGEPNGCVGAPHTVAGYLQVRYLRLPAARTKKAAAWNSPPRIQRQSVTRKQWVTRGLPKKETDTREV
jgi:hypothetical protein